MKFNRHFELEGKHAFLSPSKHSWLNYSDEKLDDVFLKSQAVKRGVELHDLACRCIRLKEKLPSSKTKSLNMYVNDAIGFKMQSEQTLKYSDNCFGTADAISFRQNILRIHDLKTGQTPAHMSQLVIYAALFCLEYRIKPSEFETELRIYQNGEILYHRPDVDEIAHVMDKIVMFDKRISILRAEED